MRELFLHHFRGVFFCKYAQIAVAAPIFFISIHAINQNLHENCALSFKCERKTTNEVVQIAKQKKKEKRSEKQRMRAGERTWNENCNNNSNERRKTKLGPLSNCFQCSCYFCCRYTLSSGFFSHLNSRTPRFAFDNRILFALLTFACRVYVISFQFLCVATLYILSYI